jgi:putative membrane protein
MMGNGFGGGGMWLFGLLILTGLVLLVLVAVRVFGGGISGTVPVPVAPPSDGHPQHSRAREILDERYARGEISTEEHRERLQELQGA